MYLEYENDSTSLKNRILDGEGLRQDFKFNISDSRKIARSLVAFANTEGGSLLIGVKDNGRIAGVRSEEEIYMLEAAANLYCRPVVKFEVREWEVENRKVLEAVIPESDQKPHYAQDKNGKWLAYIRYEDKNLLANKVFLEVLKRQNKMENTVIRYSREENLLLSYLEEHEQITISAFMKLAKISKWKAQRILINLASVGIIHVNITPDAIYYTLS